MLKITQNKLIFTIFALILGASLFGCAKKPAPVVNQNKNVNINTNTATTTAATSTAEIDTSGWKTYRNEEYGFEFKYPEDWTIINNDFRKNISFNDPVGFSLPRVW